MMGTHLKMTIAQELRNIELGKLHEENSAVSKRLEELTKELQKKLEENDKEAKKALIELAQSTREVKMAGINIALFGLTSTGKSTMLNSLLGKKFGETTTEITPYAEESFTLWDIPGRNDELSYFSMEYISFFKGLSRRIILIQAIIKENSSMMKLLDELQLSYDIVFNKFDKAEEEEQPGVRRQIQSEVQQMGLKK
jgi:GTP-binding protein EngB required for normal cell division